MRDAVLLQHGRRRLLLAAGAVAAGLAGCATSTGTARSAVRSVAELRSERVVLQEWDTSCAAAALATLLTFHLNHPISEREVASAMLAHTNPERVKARGGFSLLDLKGFAQSHGFEARGMLGLSLQALAGLAPAIVPVTTSFGDHFVVVREIGSDQVDIADPSYGNRTQSSQGFMKAWREGIAFVVTGRGGHG